MREGSSDRPSARSSCGTSSVGSRSNYAPLLVFAYNRPEHLAQCLEALARNTHAKRTRLFIFTDAAKGE